MERLCDTFDLKLFPLCFLLLCVKPTKNVLLCDLNWYNQVANELFIFYNAAKMILLLGKGVFVYR